MDRNESNKLVKGALLLTLAGLISKVLSAGYRIPLQNLAGDIGFYIYQQVYPILGIALVLALYGFPSAISKMVVDVKAKGKTISYAGFYVPIFLVLLALNGGIFLFLFFNADLLALWVGDTNLAPTYQFAAFVFLLIPFLALLRGVFQGNYFMKPTAYSQIGEQFIRVFIIIFAAVFVAVKGKHLYQIGQAAAIASFSGGLVAIIILLLFFAKNRPTTSNHMIIPWNYYVKTLLTLGIVAALNHTVLLVIQFADTFTLIPALVESGLSKMEAMEAKGVFDRAQPLIQLGTVLGASFALALIPSISKEKLKQDQNRFYQYIRGALLLSFYIAVGATIGLIAIFPEVNRLLYLNEKGTPDLQILVLAIILCSMSITASSILQGLGYIKRTAGFILIAFFVKWTLNQILVPWWGITGGAIATVLSLLVLCVIVLSELRRKLPDLNFLSRINWWALIKATIAMVIYILIIDFAFLNTEVSRLTLLGYVLFVVISGACIFLFFLLRGGAFTFASFFI